jgi:hypothetical protein
MKHFVFEFLFEGKQVVVYDFTRITHLIILNLIKVYSFGELVSFAPNYHRNFELAGEEGYHA